MSLTFVECLLNCFTVVCEVSTQCVLLSLHNIVSVQEHVRLKFDDFGLLSLCGTPLNDVWRWVLVSKLCSLHGLIRDHCFVL